MTPPYNQVVCKGFNPAHGEIAMRRLGPERVCPGALCRPAEVQGRGLFVSDYGVREGIAAFWHGF